MLRTRSLSDALFGEMKEKVISCSVIIIILTVPIENKDLSDHSVRGCFGIFDEVRRKPVYKGPTPGGPSYIQR